MGNRGNVIFTSGEAISPNVYLHWNGGPESIYAFLEELDRRGVRADADYEAARFVQIVGEFFASDDPDSGLSLGITSAPLPDIDAESLGTVHTDPSDNGFYVVDRTAGLRVRRFIEERGSLVELDASIVVEEIAAAEVHAYREGIREVFADLRLHRMERATSTVS